MYLRNFMQQFCEKVTTSIQLFILFLNENLKCLLLKVFVFFVFFFIAFAFIVKKNLFWLLKYYHNNRSDYRSSHTTCCERQTTLGMPCKEVLNNVIRKWNFPHEKEKEEEKIINVTHESTVNHMWIIC